jgi:uncharacterized protein YodC (DUF2158 family)
MTKFKTGDLVKLKSGGPIMTVSSHSEQTQYNSEHYRCDWFAGKKLDSGNFKPDQLEPAVKVDQ